MGHVLLRRLAMAVPLLLLVSLLTFALVDLSSGDAFTRLLDDPQVSEEQVALLRAQFGLDGPLPERYGRWLLNACRGDLGLSLRYRRPVAELIGERLGNTLLLSAVGLLLAWAIAVPLGVVAALRPRGLLDRGIGLLTSLALSSPRVLLALLALLFAASTGLFPVGGLHDQVHWEELGALDRAVDLAWHLALPASVLALTSCAGVLRQARGQMLDALGQDFVRTARAKGLRERAVVFRHALRVAANPLLTLLGYGLAQLVTGSFLVEVVFGWPGLARLTYEALLGKDVFLVMASVLMASATLIAGNLLADLLLAAADPRVRVQ